MKKRLLDHHPTVIALNKLEDLANELGISLEFSAGCCRVYHNNKEYDLQDIEDSRHIITGFPYDTEYKLVFETDELVIEDE